MKRLTLLLCTVVIATASCGLFKPRSYPLNTCVVCDQTLYRYGQPVVFVHDRQEIQVCSELHRQEFAKDPERMMKKVLEVKFL